MVQSTKLLEKYDTLITTKVRDKGRIIRASSHIDLLRGKLAKKIKGTNSAKIIRRMRDSR